MLSSAINRARNRWNSRHKHVYWLHEVIGLKQCYECGQVREIPESQISKQFRLKPYKLKGGRK